MQRLVYRHTGTRMANFVFEYLTELNHEGVIEMRMYAFYFEIN